MVIRSLRAKINGNENDSIDIPPLRVIAWHSAKRRNGAAKGSSGHNHGLLARLQAENAELRNKATDLALQIQALRESSSV